MHDSMKTLVVPGDVVVYHGPFVARINTIIAAVGMGVTAVVTAKDPKWLMTEVGHPMCPDLVLSGPGPWAASEFIKNTEFSCTVTRDGKDVTYVAPVDPREAVLDTRVSLGSVVEIDGVPYIVAYVPSGYVLVNVMSGRRFTDPRVQINPRVRDMMPTDTPLYGVKTIRIVPRLSITYTPPPAGPKQYKLQYFCTRGLAPVCCRVYCDEIGHTGVFANTDERGDTTGYLRTEAWVIGHEVPAPPADSLSYEAIVKALLLANGKTA